MRHIFFFSGFRSLNINLPTHVPFIKVFFTVYEYKFATRLRHEEEVSQTEFSG